MNHHQLPVSETYKLHNTSKQGLNATEAEERQKQHGKNELTEKKKVSVFVLFVKQLLGTITFILIPIVVILRTDINEKIIIVKVYFYQINNHKFMNTLTIMLSVCFLLLFPFVSKAQLKYESEYRMKSKMIPHSAKQFIKSIGPDSKVKWYKEIGLKDVSFEAKFKHKKKKFSIEFDTLGILQDVEFVINKSEIAPVLYNKIERQLDSLYHKWKFQKIQTHYTGANSDLITSINKNKPSETIKVSYEIVLKGTALGNTQLYEITFNDQGEIQDIKQIVLDKADHLEY
jgi:hypothetical protein